MKKAIILSLAILVLLTITVSPIYASSDNSLLPPWFTNAIKPIQDSINSLFTKTDNHETRITELESKIGTLEGKIASLETQIADMKETNLTIGTGSVLYNQNNPIGSVLYQQNNPIGIGTTPTNLIQLNCGSSGCPTGASLELGTWQQPIQNTEIQSQNCTAVYLNGEPLPSGQFIPSDQVTIVCK